LVKQKLFEMKR